MGSIALPALHLNPPPPQPNPLEQYGQLMQLRNQMQNAPLQHQALQQQVQAGALDVQQKQQALKDQQAMTTAMQQWDGKSLDDLPPLVLKNGGSATAVMGLKQKSLDVREKLSAIAKTDAETGASNIATLMKKNDLISGAFSTVMQAPDDQLPQAITTTAQQLAGQGLLDPQHVQMAQALAEQAKANPVQGRQNLDIMRKSMMAESQLLEEAQKKAQTAKDSAAAAKDTAESTYYQQNGGAPGVPAETRELNSYLQNNPGKTADDFVRFKAQNSPSVVVQNLSQGSAVPSGGQIDWGKVSQKYGMTPQSFDQQAEKYFSTGQLPQIGRSANAIAMNRDLMNRAAELHPNASLAENSAEYKANTNSLKTLQANFDQVSSFEGTANRNIDMLKGLAAKVPDLGTRFANVPARMLTGSMIGSENMAAFRTALAPVQAESAKILNSANLSGQLSDSSRHELQDIVDGNLPYKSLVASLNVLQQDFKNRHDSIQQQIGDIQGRIKGGSTNSTPAAQATPSGGVTVAAPNGKTYSFKDQASADAFKKTAGIQ